jgi:signal transduction histidine kinase
MAEAVTRARARAAVRASREYRHALLDEDDETALAVLGGALGERLEMPLAMASLDCASVADAMNCLIELDDQFFAWTALVAPSEQLRSLIARRLTAPPAPELKGVLRRLRASIGRAESLVRLLRELTDPKSSRGPLFVATLLADIVDVMRPVIEPSVEISVEAAPDCVTTASRTTLVVVVGALLSNALDGIRAASRGKGKISLHVFEAEDAIVVEVRDDGREIPADLRPDLMERQLGGAAPRRGLPGLRDRVRRAGGDLLVDSGPAGNSIRVFLPSGRVPEAIAMVSEAPGPVPPSTRKEGN